MSLFCESDGGDDYDWYWYPPQDEAPLTTKRSRKCCSCGERIAVGAISRKVERTRLSNSDIEERICGDEISMSDWYLCETCGDLSDSLTELGYCYSLGDGESLKQQIADYHGG